MIPEMMERELLRHYQKRARDSTVILEKAYKTHPVSELSLGDLPSTDEMEAKCHSELRRQWEAFKGHFAVEQLPLVGDLNDVVRWYFSVEAPLSPLRKRGASPIFS